MDSPDGQTSGGRRRRRRPPSRWKGRRSRELERTRREKPL
ncbi:unnamed protein product [Spirodela intermedia]|uniref:Uncharacterized protein n=1 Tax=Spirodela intermedia TaxID=51605 RepID=A0A7I8L877_SPIIN|nr:unnamed protein product [Spirodela intermedia]